MKSVCVRIKKSSPSTYQCVSSENGRVLFLFASHIITNVTFGVADEIKLKKKKLKPGCLK